MEQNLSRKNWGIWLGALERIIIFSVGIWTFFNPHLSYIREKGLVLRQAVFIIAIFIIPCLARRKRIPLKEFPFKIDALILSPLCLDTIGNFSSRFVLSYDRWDFFDKIAHFWGSGVFTFLAFVVLISCFYAESKKPEVFYLFWLCLVIGIILEGFWEVWEYYYDSRHGTILVGGLGDTIGDAVAGFFGSLTASGLCSFWYIKSKAETKKKYLSSLSWLFTNHNTREKNF